MVHRLEVVSVDDLIKTVVMQLPNFAIAVWCIYNYQQTIKGLLDQQNKLLEQLLTTSRAQATTAEFEKRTE